MERHVRSSWSLPAFATAVTFAFLVVSSLSPGEQAQALAHAPGEMPAQGWALADAAAPGAARDDFGVSRIRTAPAVGIPDPGSAQAIAYGMVLERGWKPRKTHWLFGSRRWFRRI